MIKFSLIIPVYNALRDLPELFKCIEGFTYRNLEILLIDDGSNDGSSELLDAFAEAHDGAVVLHQENMGPLLARRNGLRRATGDFIMFMDADDCLRSNAFEVCARALCKTSADIVSFRYSNDILKGLPTDPPLLSAGLYYGENFDEARMALCSGRFNELWSKAIKRECFDLAEDYSPYRGLKHGEDWFQLFSVFDSAKSLIRVEDVLYEYRRGNQSTTFSFKSEQLDDLEIVCGKALQYARSWGDAFVPTVTVGIIKQYIYLVKIVASSNHVFNEKQHEIGEIKKACLDGELFSKAETVSLRPDDRLLWALLKNAPDSVTLGIAKAVSLITPFARKLLFS